MRSYGGVLALLSAFLALAFCQLENTNVQRSLSLTSQVLQETILLAVSNKGPTPASHYDLGIEAPDHLAFLEAKEKKSGLRLAHSFIVQEGVRLARISFATPLGPEENITLSLSLVHTHVFEPFPREIPQVAKQQMRYRGNTYLYSPYPTLKTKTTLSFPSSEFTSSTSGFTHTGNKLTFGPSSARVEPFSKSEVTVHFTINSRFLCTEKLTRTLEVSHWGNNLAVEEDYKTVHCGAHLKGFYSRLDYDKSAQMHADTPVIKKIDFSLPVGATDVYYRDIIGNISTSHFHSSPFEATLELFPRFPLFGGWKTHWYHGYNLPLSNSLQVSSDGRYVLNFKFVAPYDEAVIDELVLLVTLPEGATDITFHSEFDLGVEESFENIQTYLDTYGRPVLKLVRKNVVNEHEVPVQVSYRYPSRLVLQEPFLLVAFFFTLFVSGMLLSRLDLSISKNPEDEKSEQARAIWRGVIEREDLRKDAFSKLDAALEQFKGHKNDSTYNSVKGEVTSELEQLNLGLSQAHAKLKEIQSPTQSIDQLKHLSQERWSKTVAYHAEITALVKGKSTKKRAETAEEEYQKSIAEINQKVEAILFA